MLYHNKKWSSKRLCLFYLKGASNIDNIIFKHGKDDFSFCQVEIAEADMKQFYGKGAIIRGTIDELINSIEDVNTRPNTINFFNIHGEEDFALWTVDAEQAFWEKYRNEGYSVRSNYADIKETIMDYSARVVEAVLNKMYGIDDES